MRCCVIIYSISADISSGGGSSDCSSDAVIEILLDRYYFRDIHVDINNISFDSSMFSGFLKSNFMKIVKILNECEINIGKY